MLQSYAVSLVSERPDGNLEHLLCVIEAENIDAAEGRVLARSLRAGRVIKGLISHACHLTAHPVLPPPREASSIA